MIEQLKKKDVREAAKLYARGLSMETPKGKCALNKLIKILAKEVMCFVHKTNHKIDGFVSFELKGKNSLGIDFICALKPKKGIGKKLMLKLADYCTKNRIKAIYSNVSSKDKRAMKFYDACGFKRCGRFISSGLLVYKIRAIPKTIKAALHS